MLNNVLIAAALAGSASATNSDFQTSVAPLIQESCRGCHDANTETGLNFDQLSYDLNDPAAFHQWVSVFDRVSAGEMPPPEEAQPAPQQRHAALTALRRSLHQYSLAHQKRQGRVHARRLTKLELKYTLQDLLSIRQDVTEDIPDEVDAGSFDTVGDAQRISAIHMENYLLAAEKALTAAIQLSPDPYRKVEFDFLNNHFLNAFHELPLDQGGNVTVPKENGVAMFVDADYLTRGTIFGFFVKTPGVYRITSKVGSIQSEDEVTAKLIKRDRSGGATLLQAVDIPPGEPQTFTVETFLHPGDDFYLTMDVGYSAKAVYAELFAAGGAKTYKGPGILLMEQSAEGPIHSQWPPISTTRILSGIKLQQQTEESPYEIVLTDSHQQHVHDCVRALAPFVLRRPVRQGELDDLLKLASASETQGSDEPRNGKPLLDSVNIALKTMLSSPGFLMFDESPGPLSDHALASRLSYFVWRSMPDKELFELAEQGRLADPVILREQTERLLQDPRSDRFIKDFVGQWLRLYKVNATTPDNKLYPAYDEMLDAVLPRETEYFFRELVRKNMSVDQLIDSDFTFVNRRLAQHYGLPEVKGQHVRKVSLPDSSPRGGILTQAAILKTTANGSVTSPVVRGNFVLSNLLGTPPPPPPANAGSIEPDTQGRTTIREILAAHRNNDSCRKCHQLIDPPGFALECFDPIGSYRTHYSGIVGGVAMMSKRIDSSGTTATGKSFSDITGYRKILMERKHDVARNLLARFVVFSTGAEIQFADREVLDNTLSNMATDGYRVRDLIHATVQSRMFRNK